MDKAERWQKIPRTLRPLLWWLRWRDLDAMEDKEDVILAVINDGTLAEWRWLIGMYGKETVRAVLEKRLETEFHSESRNLAKAIFGLSRFRHAR